jgi:hypothetical protein
VTNLSVRHQPFSKTKRAKEFYPHVIEGHTNWSRWCSRNDVATKQKLNEKEVQGGPTALEA